jgi:acetyl-CoA C-acetyltransferase
MGNVLSANVGQAPSRQACLGAKLPTSSVNTTINKVCASGLKAITLLASNVQLSHTRLGVAGGMESMTNAPHYLPSLRKGVKYGTSNLVDAIAVDGLTNPYDQLAMGNCAEMTVTEMKISRKEQDEYAFDSITRAKHSTSSGIFSHEIVSVPLPTSSKKGNSASSQQAPSTVSLDEEFNKASTFEKLSSLRPVFVSAEKGGSVTAGNASSINDGAAAVVLASGQAVLDLNLSPIARILSWGDAEQMPTHFATSPYLALQKALAMASINRISSSNAASKHLTMKDIEYHEINEAFAAVVIANMKLMGITDRDRVNTLGGAIALGHPIGCSGARIFSTLLNVLKQKNATIGAASICNGGGGATAVIVERLQ